MLKINKYLENAIRIGVIYTTLTTSLFVENSGVWAAQSTANPVCTHDDCRELGNMYQKYLNPHGNPCSDFYDYVCHGWENEHPKPEFEDSWYLMDTLEERAMKVLKKKLEEPSVSKVEEIEKAKEWYKACMYLPSMGNQNADDLRNIMTKVGNWPILFPENTELPINFPWWIIESQYIKMTGEASLFNIRLGTLHNKDYTIVTNLIRLYSPYGIMWRCTGWKKSPKEESHYKNFLIRIIESVAPGNLSLSKRVINKDINDVIIFRERLREIINKTSQEVGRTTINAFQTHYNFQTILHPNLYINWLHVIRAFYKDSRDPYGSMIERTSLVQVNVKYFEKLVHLLRNTTIRVIANHIHFYFAEQHIKLTPKLKEELLQSVNTKKHEYHLIRYHIPRWRWCTENHSMWKAMKVLYVLEAFPTKSRNGVNDLIEEAKKILEHQIVESSWLDYNSILWLLSRIKSIKSTVGFPNRYNSSIKTCPDEYDLDPLGREMYYSIPQNRIYVSAAYLQLPIYSPNVPYVIQYGCTMSALGHELYHSFDEKVQEASKNTLLSNYWTQESNSKYKKRTECFDKIYDKFKKREYKKHNIGLFDRFFLTKTTKEDVADAMSLKLSYRAYKKRLSQEHGVCSVLPGFEKIGCEKLFFIAFANEFCGVSTTKDIKESVFSDEHSLMQVRVNAAVANMKEFSDTFGCTTKDPMYLEKTCDIWKL